MKRKPLNDRLESIAWALFLIMIGGLLLVPQGRIPQEIWLIGAGIIMLGLNAARRLNGIKMSGFTIFLGILALGVGICGLFGLGLPVLPILFILIGASILIDSIAKKRRDLKTTEEKT